MTQFLKALIGGLCLFTSIPSHAGRFFIPPYEQSLVTFSPQNTFTQLPQEFTIAVWNVHKGKDETPWVKDMKKISQSTDLLLLQEAMDDELFLKLFTNDLKNFEWHFAKSFSYSKSKTSSGVATGSNVTPRSVYLSRTVDHEPIIGTPKTTLVSFYALNSGNKIAMFNIHGLNKTSNAAFFRQIDEALKYIDHHTGPVIFAGDFNTSNNDKMNGLKTRMEKYGLQMITYPEDHRKNHLDWIFMRDCRILRSEILYDYKTSDHTPLLAKLACE